MLSSKINDTKDIESSYPLISGDEEGHSTVEKEERTFAQKPRTIARDSLWKSLFVALLSINLLFVLIFIFHIDHERRPLLISQGLIPKIPTHVLTFQEDHQFDVDPFAEERNVWDDLIPVGRGHIAIQEPSAWNLSGGYPLEDKSHPKAEGYSISVFHQIHCLAAIKSRFMRLSANSSTHGSTKPHTHSLHIHERRKIHNEAEHVDHCFDYLRQAIMCAGDTTLEHAIIGDNGERKRVVEGWDVEHVCRDYDTIYTFAAKNHAHNQTGIN